MPSSCPHFLEIKRLIHRNKIYSVSLPINVISCKRSARAFAAERIWKLICHGNCTSRAFLFPLRSLRPAGKKVFLPVAKRLQYAERRRKDLGIDVIIRIVVVPTHRVRELCPVGYGACAFFYDEAEYRAFLGGFARFLQLAGDDGMDIFCFVLLKRA